MSAITSCGWRRPNALSKSGAASAIGKAASPSRSSRARCVRSSAAKPLSLKGPNATLEAGEPAGQAVRDQGVEERVGRGVRALSRRAKRPSD